MHIRSDDITLNPQAVSRAQHSTTFICFSVNMITYVCPLVSEYDVLQY